MKEIDMKTIWEVPRYLPYVQPPLTDAILRDAEMRLGYSLPKAYVDLLKIQNGGYIRFSLKDSPNTIIYGIGPFFPSITDRDWTEYKDFVSYELEGLIPFDGDGHWYICLDYRGNKTEPAITFIDTECDSEEKIANSFYDYLTLLEIDTEREYVIETELVIIEIVDQIASLANIVFEAPDSFASGYPVYRTKYKEIWVWVIPNNVPAGFIRKADDRYEELKSFMETYAFRYPEISETSLLISVSDEAPRLELFTLLEKNGIVIKALADLVK